MKQIALDAFDVARFKSEFPAAIETLSQIPGFSLPIEAFDGLDKVPLALRKVGRFETQGKVVIRLVGQARL